MLKLSDLHESRAKLVADMRAIADGAEAETRDLNEQEDSRFKTLKSELATLDKRIERATDLAEAERRAPAILHSGNRGDGTYEQRAREFSLVRAINARLGEPVDAGFEKEISQEVRSRSKRAFTGIAVPDEYFTVEKRVQTVAGSAEPLYPTMHRGDLFVDMLRSSLVTGRLGATVLDGLIGDQEIPKQTASSAAQWVGEEGEITGTDAGFTDIQLQPRTVGAITSFSRRTLINAVPSIENLVRRDLAAVISTAIDSAALVGDGSSNTPVGVAEQSDVHVVSMSDGPTWEKILSFVANVQHSDADIGSLGWALNAHAVKKLRSTPRDSDNGGEGFIMESPNALAGFAAVVTSALQGNPDEAGSPSTPSPAMLIFGAFSQLLVGYWSGLDVLVNPYEPESYSRGRVRIRALRDVDCAVRHGASFSVSSDMPVTA